MDWRAEVLDQLDFYWTMWRPGLDGLTDEEYFWEPVAECWSLRQVDDGWAMDFGYPEPVPSPFTTIAWRLGHISGHVFAMRASNHFGDASYRMDDHDYPGTAAAALSYLDEQKALWRNGIGALDVEGWEKSVGPAEGPFADRSYVALALHLNRELFHHGAEVSLLRDLYRASAGRSFT
ncbi:DinB family protein [Saccharopolyspora shandongensis]|uniref:DinB family protein n=1 Tax=Saccharopolyspora shandongensis TaxID=418495 RepID=UPI00342DD97E